MLTKCCNTLLRWKSLGGLGEKCKDAYKFFKCLNSWRLPDAMLPMKELQI
jgi:hypothetical protein